MISIKHNHQYIELWGNTPEVIAHAERLRSKYGYRVVVKGYEREYEQNQTIGNQIQKA